MRSEEKKNPKLTQLPDFSKARVLVVGDVMLDSYIWGDVSRVSPEAPVPVLLRREQTRVLGGAGNVAANLAGLGARVHLYGLHGEDESGVWLRQLLQAQGIVDETLTRPDVPTITKTRIMAQHQQLLRIDEEQDLGLDESQGGRIVQRILKAVSPEDVVVLSDYGKGLLTPRVCRQIIQRCRACGAPVLVDPKGLHWDKYKQASCLTPNTREFQLRTGFEAKDDGAIIEEAVRLLRSLELDCLIVTQGPQGMLLIGKHTEPRHIPARSREVFDVSGAGDTVIAALAGCLGAGCSWLEGADIANRAAGLVVGKLGTQPVSLDELRLDIFREHFAPAKIQNRARALTTIEHWRRQGQRIVFTNGCFDILHPGHVKLLQAAAAQGDRLVVGLNSDDSVGRLKGSQRPILKQEDRAAILAALESVDLVIVFSEDTPLDLIKAIKPQVLVKGGDYANKPVIGREIVEESGGRVFLVDLEAGLSTSNLVEALLRNAHQD